MPKISVIIPVYKVEKYLDKCVESVVNQTYKDLEIILVDDGSPDNCPAMCDEWAKKDSRIKVLHKQNGGLSSARNAGLDIATGEYIGFVDGSDYILPEMYEGLLGAMEKENADVAAGGLNYINPLGYKVIKERASKQEDSIISSKEAICCCYNKKEWFLTAVFNKLYKAEVWKSLRFEKGYKDEMLFHKVMKNCGKVAIYQKPKCLYLRNNIYVKTEKDFLDNCEAIILRGEECSEDTDGQWCFRNSIQVLNSYNTAKSIGFSPETEAQRKRVKNSFLKLIKNLYKSNKLSLKERVKLYINIRFPSVDAFLKKQANKIKKYKNLLRIKKMVKMCDCLLINTITHSNLGDHAIVLGEKAYLSQIKKDIQILELTGNQTAENLKFLKRIVPKEKTIFIHGGGYIGTIWEKEEERLRKFIKVFNGHRVVLLPQTVTFDMETQEGLRFFEESKRVFSSHKNITVFAREQMSFDFMRENMPEVDCRLVPDIVLSYKQNVEEKERKGLLLCLRSDIEKAMSDETLESILSISQETFKKEEIVFTDTVLDHSVSIEARQEAVLSKLRQFASAKLIVTDRLHGMVFAFLSKTPCVAMGNINGKVKAVYQWIKDCPFIKYIDRIEELPTALNELEALNEKDKEYSFNMENFKPLAQLIKEEVK